MNRKLSILRNAEEPHKRILTIILKTILEEYPDITVVKHDGYTHNGFLAKYRKGDITAKVRSVTANHCVNLLHSVGGENRRHMGFGGSAVALKLEDLEGTSLVSRIRIESVAWAMCHGIRYWLDEQVKHPKRRANGWWRTPYRPSSGACQTTTA